MNENPPHSQAIHTISSPATVSIPSAAPEKPHFLNAPSVFTQSLGDGVRFDFNDGCRISIPGGDWIVRFSDLETGTLHYQMPATSDVGTQVTSNKRYFVNWAVEVVSEKGKVYRHEFNANGREVLIQFPIGTLGDTLAWFPYAVKFQEKHGCKLTCSMSGLISPLFKDAYPNITFVTPEEVKVERFYATYRIGLFFSDLDRFHNHPCDFRLVGLAKTAGYILGVDPEEVPPRLGLPDTSRPISEKYVCIAAQASSQAKNWNNPSGWREVVKFLQDRGYRVICIDQKPEHGHGFIWNHIPYGAEDQTGDKPLWERARWLMHADFFIGLASGLSWLAWATAVPVVMISRGGVGDNRCGRQNHV